VLFPGVAGPIEYGASPVVLHMTEMILIEATASCRVIIEAQRNLRDKLPGALPAFSLLVDRCLPIIEDPLRDDLHAYQRLAGARHLL
jgi:hypothetical protein